MVSVGKGFTNIEGHRTSQIFRYHKVLQRVVILESIFLKSSTPLKLHALKFKSNAWYLLTKVHAGFMKKFMSMMNAIWYQCIEDQIIIIVKAMELGGFDDHNIPILARILTILNAIS